MALVKYFVRGGDGKTGRYTVQEVSVPDDLTDDFGEVGRYVRDRFFKPSDFVRVVGVERGHATAPIVPRESLPRLSHRLVSAITRSDKSAKQVIGNLLKRVSRVTGRAGKRWYGRVTIDLDDIPPTARSVRQYLNKRGFRGKYEWRVSSGGRGVHVRFAGSHHGREPVEVLKMRGRLGDDPKRVALDALRFTRRRDRTDLRGILFSRKGEGRVGIWKHAEINRKKRK